MRPLSSIELLNAWEVALPQTPTRRALTLLAAATPDTPVNALALLPVGERDARLMTLREWTFGMQVQCTIACPNCRTSLEMDFALNDIRIRAPDGEANGLLPMRKDGTDEPAALELTLNQAGYDVRFRLPNSLDLLALENGAFAVDDHRQYLLERCVLAAARRGKTVSIKRLPKQVVTAVTARMAEIDPQADVEITLTCQDCGHRWNAPFDILNFFWAEIHAWALRALHEVHLLALAYGWHESDILALSPWRRRLYLEMVGR